MKCFPVLFALCFHHPDPWNALYACCFTLHYDRNLQYKISASREIERQRFASLKDVMEEEFPLKK